MKIAVGGSAANPPHFSHKKLVEAIVATGEFDQVQWIISGNRPDKPGLISSRQRWEMIKHLFGNNHPAKITYEAGPAIPTIEVLDKIGKNYPQAKIVWYCGGDHFVPREKFGGQCDILGFWHEGKRLFREQEFLIIPRKGIDIKLLQLPKKYQILNITIPEISSTEIRQRIINNKPIKHLVGDAVAEYIQVNNLYI